MKDKVIKELAHLFRKYRKSEVEKWEKDQQRREYYFTRDFCLKCELLSYEEIELLEQKEELN